jgi:hypothetical protein
MARSNGTERDHGDIVIKGARRENMESGVN